MKVITDSSYEEYGVRARETLEKHYTRINNNDDDGRSYFVAIKNNQIVGVCGLHFYEWGPKDVVWSGWFHVHPDFQRQAMGTQMMTFVCAAAKERGYRRMFIEIYEDEEFEAGKRFYEKFGFGLVGKIPDYNKEGVGMLAFSKKL